MIGLSFSLLFWGDTIYFKLLSIFELNKAGDFHFWYLSTLVYLFLMILNSLALVIYCWFCLICPSSDPLMVSFKSNEATSSTTIWGASSNIIWENESCSASYLSLSCNLLVNVVFDFLLYTNESCYSKGPPFAVYD